MTARGDTLQSRHYRNQAYAPPRELPVTTISIYTDGSATARKLGQPLPPAGYGFVAVTGGSGHEHNGGRELHRRHQEALREGDQNGALQTCLFKCTSGTAKYTSEIK